MVKNTTSTEYLDGHVGKAWEALEKKFEPKTAPLKAKLHRQFYKATMKKGADPVNFITYLEDICSRLADAGLNITEEMFILQILNAVTKGYSTEVHLIKEKINNSKIITIDDVKDCLSLEFERALKWKNKGNDKDSKEGEEKAFSAFNFKGQCHYCGKYGHKAPDCPEKKRDKQNGKFNNNNSNNNNTRTKFFDGTCNFCGIRGHREADC